MKDLLGRETGSDASADLVREVLGAGLEAAEPARCFRREWRRWLAEDGTLAQGPGCCDLLAVGKAAAELAAAAHSAFGELGARPRRTFVVAPLSAEPCLDGDDVVWRRAEHPLPGERGEAAARELEEWVTEPGDAELLVLLSGGASAMLPAPAAGVGLETKRELTRRLLESGADIRALNSLRVALSRIKGGRLAARSGHRRITVLVLSDVVGDDLQLVASGPFYPSRLDESQRLEAVARACGDEREARSLLSRVESPPAADHPLFERVEHRVIGSGARSLEAMVDSAGRAEGIVTESWGARLAGEASEVAEQLVRRALDALDRGLEAPRAPRGTLFLGAGETTVTVRGGGRGGRNQELALAFAVRWEEGASAAGLVHRPWSFASLGTDGVDGPTDAAGGLVGGGTLAALRREGLDPCDILDDNDSHTALAAVDGLIQTGPTGTNVGDLVALHVASSRSDGPR